jgi:prephenate dehydrogenase
LGSLTEPPFKHIAIFGLGLIGGSIALAARRRWPSVQVIAIDRPQVIDAAVRMHVVDRGGDDVRAAEPADLVMLAAPVLQNVAALKALPDRLPRSAVVTDAGSTKRVMLEAAAELPERFQFVGGHPLAGAAVSGIEAARPDLFDDRPWILTRSERTLQSTVAALTQFITGLRAIPQLMDAAEHDRLLAYLSHLPQLTVSALMHVVGTRTGEGGLAFAGRGLRDTTRLASSPAAPWRDIVATNGDNICSAVDDLISALQQLKAAHDGGADAQARLEQMFLSAARWKGVLEHG